MQCQFCNNHFMTAEHYGHYLYANHSKEQRSKSLHESPTPSLQSGTMTRKWQRLSNLVASNIQAPPSNLQSLTITCKRCRLRNLVAANIYSYHHWDCGDDLGNINSPVGSGSTLASSCLVVFHMQDLQTSTNASDLNHGLDSIKLPHGRGTALAPNDPVASYQQYLPEVLMVRQVIRWSLFIDIRNP